MLSDCPWWVETRIGGRRRGRVDCSVAQTVNSCSRGGAVSSQLGLAPVPVGGGSGCQLQSQMSCRQGQALLYSFLVPASSCTEFTEPSSLGKHLSP